jgi:hypothetical protein
MVPSLVASLCPNRRPSSATDFYSRLRDSAKRRAAADAGAGGQLPIAGAAAAGGGRDLRGAERLAEAIRAYWTARGYGDVATSVAVVSRRAEGRTPISAVRSNLSGGMPPAMAGRWRPPPRPDEERRR